MYNIFINLCVCRFFPEGVVLMLTTADEPSQCVGLMKTRNARGPVLSGYYRLKNDKVVIVIQKQDAKTVAQVTQGFKRNSRKKDAQENAEQTFHLVSSEFKDNILMIRYFDSTYLKYDFFNNIIWYSLASYVYSSHNFYSFL